MNSSQIKEKDAIVETLLAFSPEQLDDTAAFLRTWQKKPDVTISEAIAFAGLKPHRKKKIQTQGKAIPSSSEFPAKICCIDFETANESRGSACSVGIAMIENGRISHTEERLIKPHASCSYFDPFNISIHGIRSRDVAGQPDFKTLSGWLFKALNADLVVAHNAAFDMSVLRSVCNLYNMPYPTFTYFCTYKAATKVWPNLLDHKLNTLAEHINHKFKHHNAEADAEAAGLVLLKMLEDAGTATPTELADKIGMKLGQLTVNGYKPCSLRKTKGKRRE